MRARFSRMARRSAKMASLLAPRSATVVKPAIKGFARVFGAAHGLIGDGELHFFEQLVGAEFAGEVDVAVDQACHNKAIALVDNRCAILADVAGLDGDDVPPSAPTRIDCSVSTRPFEARQQRRRPAWMIVAARTLARCLDELDNARARQRSTNVIARCSMRSPVRSRDV